MNKFKTISFLLTLSLLSLTLFLYTNWHYLTIPFISITIIYLSGGLTKQYKPVWIHSLLGFVVFIINFLVMFILFNLNIFNIYTIVINIVVFLFLYINYYLMYKKIEIHGYRIFSMITEVSIISRFIPIASYFIFMPWILTSIVQVINHNDMDTSTLFLNIAAFIFVWAFVIRRNIRFLKQNVRNANNNNNILKFISITTFIPIVIQLIFASLYHFVLHQDVINVSFHVLFSTSIIVQIIYLRNFAQKLISTISKQSGGFNPFDGFTAPTNNSNQQVIQDDIVDAEIVS